MCIFEQFKSITHLIKLMKNFLTLSFLFFVIGLFAQAPVNDDCDGIIDLGVVPFCPVDTFFTNLNATATDIGNNNIPFGCNPGGDWTSTDRDVWFTFITSDTIEDYTITLTGITDGMGSDPIANPQIAIYRGNICGFDEIALFFCARAENDGDNSLTFDISNLDISTRYFIRVNDWSSTTEANSGSFQLCIEEEDPINIINEMGSSDCTGELFDSGGPNGDYTSNENNSFTICPTAPNDACVTFNLTYYNLGIGDFINFYDGDNVNTSPLIGSLGNGANFGGDPDGGVCYTTQASSGCLTVEMTSDQLIEFEGFAGMWECSTQPCEPINPIAVDPNINDQDIIDAITTPQTQVSIDTIICENGQYGTFIAGDDTDLGLEKGLLLTSGSVTNAIGPNTLSDSETLLNTPGDSILDLLSMIQGDTLLSFDACIVQLEVFVATNELNFEYVFGSEEYPEFVQVDGGGFNDIFAFLISGPGITDPNLGLQKNIALIPGTNDPVEINSVNNIVNWEYYRNNQDGQSTEYDGLTSDFQGFKKSLTATTQVEPCNTYTLRLGIADRGDSRLDSGVFIGELVGATPNLDFVSNLNLENLVESCTGDEDEVLLTLNNESEDTQIYNVVIGGTPTRNVDYTLDMPSTVTLPPGENSFQFSIVPIADGFNEGSETIIITLTNDFGCGVVELQTLTINLLDQPELLINLGIDSVKVCQDSCITLTATGVTDFDWFPSNLFLNNQLNEQVYCPTSSQTIKVEGTISDLPGCFAEDSIFVEFIDPSIELVTMDITDICQGDSVRLDAINNTNNSNLLWTPVAGLSDPNSSTPTAIPMETTTYVASVNLFGCIVSDELTINVDPFDFPEVVDDVLICTGNPLQLASTVEETTTIYQWTPAEFLDDDEIAGPTVIIPDEGSYSYTLNAMSTNGNCNATASVNIEVLEARVNVLQPDTVFICLGDTAQLDATSSAGPIGFQWSPADSLIGDPSTLSVMVNPTISTWYYSTLTVGSTETCSVIDSVFVKVDSLPDLSVQLFPMKDPYCPGDIVTMASQTFEPSAYPDIQFLWQPNAGFETDSTFLNLVISTIPDTITYQRFTINNACMDTTDVLVNTVDPIILLTEDTIACVGDVVQLMASTEDPEAEFTWDPETGLSCADCPMPEHTVTSTQTYNVTADVHGCPAMNSVTITAIPSPELDLAIDPIICFDESIILNNSTDPDATYIWSSDDDASFTDLTNPMPNVSPDFTSTYTVVVSKEGCPSVTEDVRVEVIQPVVLDAGPDQTTCVNTWVEFNAVVTPETDGIFQWNTGSGPMVAVRHSTPGDRLYHLFYDNDCELLRDTLILTVFDSEQILPIQLPEGFNTDEDCFDEGGIFNLSVQTDTIFPGSTVEWFQNNSSIGNGRMIQIQPIEGPVTYRVDITTENGCVTSGSLNDIRVCPAQAAIPNAFTPDADGMNDYFNVVTKGLYEGVVSFRVWDRFGELVYNNQNEMRGWDGMYKNKLMPSDVYLYHIVVRKFSGEEEDFRGDVTLIR